MKNDLLDYFNGDELAASTWKINMLWKERKLLMICIEDLLKNLVE